MIQQLKEQMMRHKIGNHNNDIKTLKSKNHIFLHMKQKYFWPSVKHEILLKLIVYYNILCNKIFFFILGNIFRISPGKSVWDHFVRQNL